MRGGEKLLVGHNHRVEPAMLLPKGHADFWVSDLPRLLIHMLMGGLCFLWSQFVDVNDGELQGSPGTITMYSLAPVG